MKLLLILKKNVGTNQFETIISYNQVYRSYGLLVPSLFYSLSRYLEIF